MPKVQSKGCQRKKRNEQEPGENQQQLDIDCEDKDRDQESCGTLDPTKSALAEKNAAFFKDRLFYYDVQNEHYKNRSRRDAELGEFAVSIVEHLLTASSPLSFQREL